MKKFSRFRRRTAKKVSDCQTAVNPAEQDKSVENNNATLEANVSGTGNTTVASTIFNSGQDTGTIFSEPSHNDLLTAMSHTPSNVVLEWSQSPKNDPIMPKSIPKKLNDSSLKSDLPQPLPVATHESIKTSEIFQSVPNSSFVTTTATPLKSASCFAKDMSSMFSEKQPKDHKSDNVLCRPQHQKLPQAQQSNQESASQARTTGPLLLSNLVSKSSRLAVPEKSHSPQIPIILETSAQNIASSASGRQRRLGSSGLRHRIIHLLAVRDHNIDYLLEYMADNCGSLFGNALFEVLKEVADHRSDSFSLKEECWNEVTLNYEGYNDVDRLIVKTRWSFSNKGISEKQPTKFSRLTNTEEQLKPPEFGKDKRRKTETISNSGTDCKILRMRFDYWYPSYLELVQKIIEVNKSIEELKDRIESCRSGEMKTELSKLSQNYNCLGDVHSSISMNLTSLHKYLRGLEVELKKKYENS